MTSMTCGMMGHREKPDEYSSYNQEKLFYFNCREGLPIFKH